MNYQGTHKVTNELAGLLEFMDVPSFRKEINKNNLIWLSKNLSKRNSDHPDYARAVELIQISIRDKIYNR